MSYLYLCPLSRLFLLFTSSSSLKREELPTATDQKWLMRLRRKDYNKMNPGETNEDCPGVDNEAALKKARKRTKSFLTRAGKRGAPYWIYFLLSASSTNWDCLNEGIRENRSSKYSEARRVTFLFQLSTIPSFRFILQHFQIKLMHSLSHLTMSWS